METCVWPTFPKVATLLLLYFKCTNFEWVHHRSKLVSPSCSGLPDSGTALVEVCAPLACGWVCEMMTASQNFNFKAETVSEPLEGPERETFSLATCLYQMHRDLSVHILPVYHVRTTVEYSTRGHITDIEPPDMNSVNKKHGGERRNTGGG